MRGAGTMRAMPFAIATPIPPMLAKRAAELPAGDGWLFEPKWDGFRALVFRGDEDELLIQSRDGKPLDRYFPELHEPLKAALPPGSVLDGEIVIARSGALDFDALQLRVHPAASRIKLLAGQTPASVVFFDLLALGGEDLRAIPFVQRREQMERLLAEAPPPLHLTPATRDHAVAMDWFRRFEGAGLDGVMAKSLVGLYEPGKRTMVKVKHERDCDCVVAGFRWHKNGDGTAIGSLLLGLFRCFRFTPARRRLRQLHAGKTAGARRLPRSIPHRRASRPPVGNCAGREHQRKCAAHARRTESLEPGKRPLLGAAAARARRRGRLRAHAGEPLPAHGAVPQVAHRQGA